MNIEDFDLTEEDFSLIMKALEHLPSSGLAGEIIGKLIVDTMPRGGDPNAKARVESAYKAQQRRLDQEKEVLTEEIRLLQGKLIAIKRKLATAGALKQATDVLKNKQP